MTFESQSGVGARHTHAIINDLDGGAPGIDHRHIYVSCLGIDGILDQFLDDRGRTLYHLSRSYLIGHTIG